MKLQSLILTLIIFLNFNNLIICKLKAKGKTKGDIPKFCSPITEVGDLNQRVNENVVVNIKNTSQSLNITMQELTGIVTAVRNCPKLLDFINNHTGPNCTFKNDTSQIFGVSNFDNDDEGIWKYLLRNILGIYSVFSVLSWFKWIEEIDRIKKDQINTRFAHFIDLSEIISLDLNKYENKFVFVNGVISTDMYANDNLFNFDNERKYMKIKRKVELFDILNNKWVDSSEIPPENLNAIELVIEDKDVLISLIKIFKEETFIGTGFLKGIQISEQYFKKIETSENIKFELKNLFNVNQVLSEYKDVEVKIEKEVYLVISLRSPLENKMKKMIRISLLGFKGDQMTVIAKIKGRAFKNILLPLENEISSIINKTEDINNPPKMEVVLEVSCNPVNLLFCCCLNDTPYYKYTNNDIHEINENINWVTDRIKTKQEFLFEKHDISTFKIYFFRFLFGLIVFAILYFFPEPLYLFYSKLCYEKEILKAYFILFDTLMSVLLIFLIVFYANLNWTNKAMINLLIMGLFLFFLILAVFKVLLKLV